MEQHSDELLITYLAVAIEVGLFDDSLHLPIVLAQFSETVLELLNRYLATGVLIKHFEGILQLLFIGGLLLVPLHQLAELLEVHHSTLVHVGYGDYVLQFLDTGRLPQGLHHLLQLFTVYIATVVHVEYVECLFVLLFFVLTQVVHSRITLINLYVYKGKWVWEV